MRVRNYAIAALLAVCAAGFASTRPEPGPGTGTASAGAGASAGAAPATTLDAKTSSGHRVSDPPRSADDTGTISVQDDQGRTVTLPYPARRAVSLAPHATELVYAAGAGDKLAGVARGSDYPPQARTLPSVGNGLEPDAERVAALKPDLVIGWQPSAMATLLPTLDALDVPVYYSDPRSLRAIPTAIERMGVLFGTSSVADPAAAALRARIDALARRYAGREPVRVFVQAGREPLYTLNGNSIVSDALKLCGGVNVFADAPITAPQVSPEAVLAVHPDAILTGTSDAASLATTVATWRALRLPAALAGHVIGIDADALYRPGPRLIAATETLCEDLDRARGGADTKPRRP